MRLWRIVAIALAALLTLTLIQRFVLVELLLMRIGIPLLAALVEALAIVGAGVLARRSRTVEMADFVVGYPIFGTLCFLVGLLRVNTLTMMSTVVLLAAVGATVAWLTASAPLPVARTLERPFVVGAPVTTFGRASAAFGIVAIAVVLLCGFVAAQAPPTTLDEVAYHLAIPHTWVTEGRAVDLPLISHSYFPLGIESADLPLLTLLGPVSGGVASHFLHLFAAVMTAALVYRSCGRDWLLTAAIVTAPALALTAGWSLVEWPLLGICIVLADDLERKNATNVSAAIAAGLLAKYTFIPLALVLLIAKRQRRGVLTGVALGSIFFIRNLILTGNPVAPFLMTGAPHVGGYRTLALASYIFDGSFIDESLGASLLSAAVLATGAIGLAALAAGALLFAAAPSARLLVPFFGVAATKAAPQVERSAAIRIVLGVAIAVQLLLVGFFIERNAPFSLVSGQTSDLEYVGRSRPAQAAVAWLNTVLPAASRTLVVGLNETYWFARPVRGGGNFDGPRVSRYLDTTTPEALRQRLARDGITHVAVIAVPSATASSKKLEERQTTLAPGAQRALSQMLDRYAASVTSRGGATLFTLR